ncbi:MAG: hypothetical protein HY958_12170 [Bacteroidia bacterium]|nr:hypothetical protein [Bacteroidia bacterium]
MKRFLKILVCFILISPMHSVLFGQNPLSKYPENDLKTLYYSLVRYNEFQLAGIIRAEINNRNIQLEYSNFSLQDLEKMEKEAIDKKDYKKVNEIEVEINIRNIYLPQGSEKKTDNKTTPNISTPAGNSNNNRTTNSNQGNSNTISNPSNNTPPIINKTQTQIQNQTQTKTQPISNENKTENKSQENKSQLSGKSVEQLSKDLEDAVNNNDMKKAWELQKQIDELKKKK